VGVTTGREKWQIKTKVDVAVNRVARAVANQAVDNQAVDNPAMTDKVAAKKLVAVEVHKVVVAAALVVATENGGSLAQN
jgi:hypothetical protein